MPQIIVLLVVIILYGLYSILNRTFDRSKKKYLSKSKDLYGVDYSLFKQDQDWFEQIVKTEHIIESLDGLKLHASFIPNKHSNVCVILCHGYSVSRKSMAVFARHYYETYHTHICMIDARTHGLSEGKTIGFGYHDRNDIHLWINALKVEFGADTQIILHGVSMGASTLLYASLDGFDSSVKGIITDSAFINLRPIFIRQMKQIYHLPAFPFIYLVDFFMRFIYRIPFSKTNIIKQKDKLLTPCLIIHGTSDRFVPYDMAVTLNQIYTGYHMFLPIANANHALAFGINPILYKESIRLFLEYCLN